LPRALLADDAREVARAEARVERADARAVLPEDRVLGRDGDVCEHVQDVTAADRDAVHRGDHRLGDRADDAVQLLDLEQAVVGRAVVARLGALLLIAPRTERAIPLPRQHRHADVSVGPRELEAVKELVDGLAAKRVVALGPRDRYPRDSLLDLVM